MTGRASLAWFALVIAPLALPCAAGGTAPVWEQDEADIQALLAASIAAWNRADLEGHLAIYDPSVTVMTDTGPRPGIDPIRASFSAAYFRNGKPLQSLAAEEVTVRPLGREAALMTGRFRLTGGGEPERTGWFTLVWQRTAAGWRAVHDHTR